MIRHPASAVVLSALAMVTAGLGACGGGAPDPGTGAGASTGVPGAIGGTITVLAAASLTGSFTELGRRFETANPGVRVRVGFGPSSGLAAQIRQGSPADVFASASEGTMAAVVAAGDAASPQVFAVNTMAVAVPPDNPARVTSVADLARPGVTVAVCRPQVPCGAAAAALFDKSGLTVTPVTLEADVKAVLTKVQLGEVDAGVVYVTDVQAAGPRVLGVRVSPGLNVSTRYPIAVLSGSGNRATAEAFAAFVRSAEGATVLARAGFGSP